MNIQYTKFDKSMTNKYTTQVTKASKMAYEWLLMNSCKRRDKTIEDVHHLGSGSIAIACHTFRI